MRSLFFDLGYKQHGGGGLSYTEPDCWAMAVPSLIWARERLGEVREQEAKALADAHAKTK